jgi:hypothetical protein
MNKNTPENTAPQISRRHFLGLAAKTSLIGFGALVLSKIPGRAAVGGDAQNSQPRNEIQGNWRVELLNDYPYPASIRRYAEKAKYTSLEKANEYFRSRKWPVKIYNSAI